MSDDIWTIGLDRKIVNCLLMYQIDSIEKLFALGSVELLKIPGIGIRGFKTINEKLDQFKKSDPRNKILKAHYEENEILRRNMEINKQNKLNNILVYINELQKRICNLRDFCLDDDMWSTTIDSRVDEQTSHDLQQFLLNRITLLERELSLMTEMDK